IDAEPAQRQSDLVVCLGVGALTGLRREEEPIAALTPEPRRDDKLRIAVARGGVEMIQVVAEHELEGAIGFGLSDLAQRGATEDRPPALMSGGSERRARYHPATIVRCADRSLESRRREGTGRHSMAISTAKPTAKFTYREVTLQDRLREVAREVGEKPALVMGDRSVTFREIDQLSDQLAVALAKRGVQPGDRVTIFMPNCIEFVIAFYGTLKAGGVVNQINSQSKEREVRFQVGDSGSTAVLYHAALAPVVDAVRSELTSVRVLGVAGDPAPNVLERFDDA